VQHVHAGFCFDVPFVLSGNSSVTLPAQEKRGVTMATNIGTIIAINAYKCVSTRDDENVITYNIGLSLLTTPNKIFVIARV